MNELNETIFKGECNLGSLEKFQNELSELRDTQLRLAEHLGPSPNFLLSNYFKFGGKVLSELERVQNQDKDAEIENLKLEIKKLNWLLGKYSNQVSEISNQYEELAEKSKILAKEMLKP
jgi:hypothetical protein